MLLLHGKPLEKWTKKQLVNHAKSHNLKNYSKLKRESLFIKLCELEKSRGKGGCTGDLRRKVLSPKRLKVLSPKRRKQGSGCPSKDGRKRIRNPVSGRCVYRDGQVGRRIRRSPPKRKRNVSVSRVTSPKRKMMSCGEERRLSPTRKSPPYSATHCPNQTRRGVDGNLWKSKPYSRKGKRYYRWARA